MTHDELIGALEKATGPDRELNKLLVPFVGLRLVEEGHPLGSCCYDQNGHGVPLPTFTASIDAALTLAEDKQAVLREALRWIGERFRLHINLWPEDQDYAQWLAIAICIAALRAHGGSHG